MTKAQNRNIPKTPRRRKIMSAAENVAALGMLLVCAALVIPLFGLTSAHALDPYKWIYSAGTLLYIVARVVGAMDSSGTVRLRRLRRMEFWAGVCFMIGAAFWFYQEGHLGPLAGPLAVIRDTILFTLAGAMVQIIASWLIYAQEKKIRAHEDEQREHKK